SNGDDHLGGGSRFGKTGIACASASCWGMGAQRRKVRSWRATDSGIEVLAQAACDGLLVLDELGQGKPSAVGDVIYLLGDGGRKARMGPNGKLRDDDTPSRLVFLSTGEMSVDSMLKQGRRNAMAGMAMRLVEIAADAGAGLG